MFGILTTLLFPERCVRCKAAGTLLCASCSADLHPRFRRVHDDPAAWSLFSYADPRVKRLLAAWKYRGNQRAGAVLLGYFKECCTTLKLPAARVLIPIPTQRSHNNRRGFAPPVMLARALEETCALPMMDPLRFRRRTQRQAGLPLTKRTENMHNAFVVRATRSPLPQSVILIDDVLTTGATLRAAVHALQQCGVQNIRAITLAWNP